MRAVNNVAETASILKENGTAFIFFPLHSHRDSYKTDNPKLNTNWKIVDKWIRIRLFRKKIP
jgi:hypothetical protein